MAGLRDVVRALAERPGVTAVIVVSGDGLTIDQAGGELDTDTVAALVPAIVSNAKRLGTSSSSQSSTSCPSSRRQRHIS
jgi:predicted regulator of Ras-like GTPase activity (Roadblock/LC7/MglB family)